jgi:hypothetical protein
MLINAREAIAGEVQLVSERARQLFTQSAFNNVLRLAAFKAGNQFIEDRLPVRWSPGWARNQGGYAGKGGRDRIPFFERGTWIRSAQNAHPVVAVTKGTVRLKVVVPVGHALQSGISAAFKTTTPADVRCIADAFRAAAEKILSGAKLTPGKPNTGKMKATLSAETLAAAAATRGRNANSGIRGEVKELLSPRLAQLADQHADVVRWNKGHRAWQLNLWRRRAGGAAGPTQSQMKSGDVVSQAYLGHKKRRHAMHQALYRQRQQNKKLYRQQLGT